MTPKRAGGILRLGGAAILAGFAVQAGAVNAHPDFSGRYFSRPGFGRQGTRDASLNQVGGDAHPWRSPPPLKGDFAAGYARILQSRRDGKPLGDNSARCLPGFASGAFGNPYPIELIQKPGLLLVLFEGADRVRRIYIGGKHPARLTPQFYGHSIGHWEGASLVVDTVGFRADTTLADGAPHSDRLHAVERLTWIRGDKGRRALQWDFSFTDPQALSAPFSMRYDLDADPKVRMMEYSCEQNNRNVVNERGETQSPGGA